MSAGSIRGRLLFWSGALTAAALVLAWIALSAVLSDFVTRRLEAELAAGARAVMAAAEWDAAGRFDVIPAPADPRFERPLSGWYWQVSDGTEVLARAPSLVTGDLGPDGARGIGPDGAALIAHRARFTAPGDGRTLTVAVTLPAAEAAAELATVRRPLLVALAVLGAGLLVAQVVAVRAGLRDLTRFARSVAQVRDGTTGTVPRPAAAELRPLADELDRLIAARAAQVERARAHAGDLAHALKTPLAVLSNRAGPEEAALIARMDRIIRWHLDRARASAAGLDPAAHCAVAPALQDVALVLAPGARRQGIALDVRAEGAPDFRGDAEDLIEIVGTLAENAVAWAAARVRITAAAGAGGLVIDVADDGPGIPAPDRDRLLARGARLDESTQGHGLGLAIAADRVRAYGGTLVLDRADLGGLLARVTLPARG
ncbi:sensor histidine kinase [Roseivivax isoporae]|uniref:histidine kinase n=1 Tax=Roseivivax isoporae LMG 25204 TaxID=1449351 RepID=X7F2Q6_9RHOB|nr:HAMP domain-containing sensor histidine kinase [Roseivivax isoporae]ETX27045.1 histidine kinase [Roseivivax isoporae LMG 25204]